MTSIIWPLGCARVWNRIKPVKCPALVYFYTKNSTSENGKVTCFFVENSLAASTFTDTRCFYHANNHPTFLVCWLCFYNTINHIDWLWCCGGGVFIYFYCYNPTQQYTTLNHLFRISFTFVGCKYFSSNTNLWTRLEFLLCC